jgi:3-phosphoshikimate 1-carboxyvinyltransferase
LACLLLLGHQEYKLILGNRLKLRPWDDFILIAQSINAKVSLEDNILSIQGPGQFPAVLNVDCSKTTQFATGFNLLSPVTGSEIVVNNFHSSQSYLHMTLKMVEEMKMMSGYVIPGDWSSASYALAFSALNQPLLIEGLAQDFYQADSKLFGILKELHCLEETSSGLVIKPTLISKSFDLDVSDCLDLVPTLGYLFSHIEGIHHLRNVQNLIYKESDRLSEVMKLIIKFNRKAYLHGDDLIIEGSQQLITNRVDLSFPDDHRLVMTGALFLLHHQGGTLFPAESVNKSYPDFF